MTLQLIISFITPAAALSHGFRGFGPERHVHKYTPAAEIRWTARRTQLKRSAVIEVFL